MRNIAASYPNLFCAATASVLTGAALLALTPQAARSDEIESAKQIEPPKQRDLNSFTFSGRFGFNISARFKDAGTISFGNMARKTPDGVNYNYDDGYVFADSSGPGSGSTWNWGYDNSATQVSGNNILLSKTVGASSLSSPSESAPAVGGELVYRREFHDWPEHHDIRWGIEAAGNLANLSVSDHRTYNGSVTTRTDAYAFEPDTTPPDATPGSPYQGTFNGPGFLIGDTPVSSTFSSVGAIVTGNSRIDADLWGFRLGPYVEIPVYTNVNLSLSGGFAGGWVNVDASWIETLSVGSAQFPISGSGHDNELRLGYYVGANAEWAFKPRWSLNGGVQFQSLANYDQPIEGRRVEIDLSKSVFVTLGLGYHF